MKDTGQIINSSKIGLAWKKSIPGLSAVFLITAFINLLKLAVPLYIFQLLDRVLSSQSIDTLIVLAVITMFAVIACCLSEIIRRWLLIRWGIWIEQNFGEPLFIAALEKSDRTGPGKYLKDLTKLRIFVSGGVFTAWLDLIWTPAFVVVVYLISPLLAFITLLCISGIFLLGILNEITTREPRGAATRATAESQDWIATAEHNSEMVGSLNLSDRLARLWNTSLTNRLEENFRTKINSSIINNMMKLFQDLGRIAVFGFGILLVINGELSVGGVIAAGVLGRMAASSVRRVMSRWRHLKPAYGAYCRIKRRLRDEPELQSLKLDGGTKVPLIVEELSHRYTLQPRSLFRRVNLKLYPGQILNVIGQSGTGKSTFTKILSGYLLPRSGRVRLGDVDISQHSSRDLYYNIGYLHQDTKLFPGSIRENIAGMERGDIDAVIEAAKLANIHDIIIRLPKGYDTQIGGQENILSGSEQKRVAFARALYCWPRLIVLDEPEANLDAVSRKSLVTALLECKTRQCIVVITSQSDLYSEIADQVMNLRTTSRTSYRKVKKQLKTSPKKNGKRQAGAAIIPK